MLIPLLKSGLIILLCVYLSGCAAIAAGGAATGAAVAYDRRTTGTVIEDQAIEMKAMRALRSDSEIDDKTHINVTSYNKVVLMTGEAPTEELRSRAVDLVSDVPEVSKVYNEVALVSPSSYTSRSSDTFITTKVKTKLFAETKLDATRIKVVTERGIVYLMGLVNAEEADMAAEIARHVNGVQKVVKLFQGYAGRSPDSAD